MKNLLTQFKKDLPKSQPIVFCVQCGSTNVDQNFRNQIKCSNCQNISIWDADRFSIAREGSEQDAKSGFEDGSRLPKSDDGNWREAILASILPLIHKLSDMPLIFDGPGSPKISGEDFDELTRKWREVRVRVDAVIEDLIQRDDAIDE